MEPQAPQNETNAPQPPTAVPPPTPAPVPPAPELAVTPLNPTPQNPVPELPTTPPSPTQRKKLLGLIIIIVVALIIVSGAIYLLLPKQSHTGPKLFVGSDPYLFACSTTSPDTMASTAGFSTDRKLQGVEQKFQLAPDNTKDKQLDLLKLTGAKSISNSCQVFTVNQAATKSNPVPGTQSMYASVTQFTSSQAALQNVMSSKTQGDQPLPGFANNSFYTSQSTPDQSSPNDATISAFIAYKNTMLGYVAVVPANTQASSYASKFAALASKAIANINSGAAAKVSNFTGYTSIGGNAFVDACTAPNYAKVAKMIAGGIELDPASVQSEETYGQNITYSDPPVLDSTCTFAFRTTGEEAAAVAATKKETSNPNADSSDTSVYDSGFSHYIEIGVATVANPGDIQKSENAYSKSQGAVKLTNVKIDGQNGYKSVTSDKDDNGNTIDTYRYLIPNGNHLFSLQMSLTRQTTPYTTTNYVLSDTEAAKVFQVLLKTK